MSWLLVGMALMAVLLVLVVVSWVRSLVRLDQELRGRARQAALVQKYDLVDGAAPDWTD